jgi:uncharacterized protein (DUF58 family)
MSQLRESISNQVPLADPTALAKFGKLEVVARLIVEGSMFGQHKSPFKGSSVEFVEHRQYYPGDEIRHIDWRAYGKTGKYYIKEFEDETNLRCHLLVDASGSMGYSGSTLSKFDYARYLAASLGYLLHTQRDATGLVTFDTDVRVRVEPSANVQNYQRMVGTLEQTSPGGETSLAQVFEKVASSIARRSLLIVLSDCLDRFEPLAKALKQFRHAKHEVIVFHIVAPEEAEFPFSRPTQFRNLERANDCKVIDPHQFRAHYLEQYMAFCSELAKLCGTVGADYQKLITTQPYDIALGAFLDARTRRKAKTWR